MKLVLMILVEKLEEVLVRQFKVLKMLTTMKKPSIINKMMFPLNLLIQKLPLKKVI